MCLSIFYYSYPNEVSCGSTLKCFVSKIMNNSFEISQSNNQYIRQFNRAVLDYEILILEERQQKKAKTTKSSEKKKVHFNKKFAV
jgi:hypothetical protein